MAGKVCQVIGPILLRRDRAMEYKYIGYCGFTVSCPLTEKHIHYDMQERWKKKRDSNISDFTRWLETYRKERLKCHSGFFFFFCRGTWQRNFCCWYNCWCDLEKLTWVSNGVISKSSMCKESICVLFSPDHSASKLGAKERKSCSITMLHWRQQGYFRRQQAWY